MPPVKGDAVLGSALFRVFLVLASLAASLGLSAVPAAADHSSVTDPHPLVEHTASEGFVSVHVGREHSCALTREHRAYCWGNNVDGQTGAPPFASGGEALPVTPGEGLQQGNIKQISTGDRHTCAVDFDRFLYCWGDGGSTGLAADAPAPVLVPTGVGGPVQGQVWRVSAGGNHSCATSASPRSEDPLSVTSHLHCWGDNTYDKLGGGTQRSSWPIPVQVRSTDGSNVSTSWTDTPVEAGVNHSCGAAGGGGLFCWGRGDYGVWAPGNSADYNTAIAVSVYGATPASLATGDQHTCMISNFTYCWGRNDSGQVGTGSTSTDVPFITQVTALGSSGAEVKAAPGVSCARTWSGDLYCWGSAAWLGSRPSPFLVATGVMSMDMSEGHICAVRQGGSVLQCKGNNTWGQLGSYEPPDAAGWVTVRTPISTPPVLEAPADNHIFAPGEPQVFRLSRPGLITDEPYRAQITVRNAVTNAVVTRFDTIPSAMGTPAVATPPTALPPGSYTWTAEFSGGTGVDSPSRRFGVASTTAVISATCTGATLVDGFAGAVYARARTGTGSDRTYVCLRGDAGVDSPLNAGGRLEISGPATIENDTTACQVSGGTVVPLVHTQVGDPSDPATYGRVDGDVRTDANSTAVCMRVTYGTGTLTAAALRIRTSGVTVPDIRFVPDQSGHAAPAPVAPAPGLQSSACQASGSAVRLLNLTLGASHVALHTISTGGDVAVCARLSGPAAGGGRLDLEPMGEDPLVSVDAAGADPGEAGHPCSLVVANWTSAPDEVHVRRSATGLGENWLCVNVGGDGGVNVHVRLSTGGSTVPDAQWHPDA